MILHNSIQAIALPETQCLRNAQDLFNFVCALQLNIGLNFYINQGFLTEGSMGNY